MDREIRRSGLNLAIAGVLGVLFFWLTDPAWGLFKPAQARESPVDAVNEALIGTTVGIAGSAVVLLLGLWIATRRPT
jgi:hypothetical protein